jgi:hypothetical protein
MIHTRELELAARDFGETHRPDYDLSARVKKYTNWDGELNEIVHYSKCTARGIDVLVNMVLSDFVGDTKNIDTIFNPDYRFFGVRVQAHDLHDYCVVVIFAVEIYSSLKSALYTSANIDEEMLFERETLSKKILQNNNYNYSSRYVRDNPDVHLSMYLNSAQKSKRKVRLTENGNGDSTMTVLRRDSLERNPQYKNHDDVDYKYSNEENQRFTHVPDYNRPMKRNTTMGKGERIVRQDIVDYDKETYSKHFDNGSMYSKRELNGDPHTNRQSVRNWDDYDSKLYYGDLNDISRFEERVTGRYSHINLAPVSTRHDSNEYFTNEYNRGPESLHNPSLRKVKKPRMTVEQVHHQPINNLQREVQQPRLTFRDTHFQPANNLDGVEVTYQEYEDEPVETSFRVTSNRHIPDRTSLRVSNSNRNIPTENTFRSSKIINNRPVETSFRNSNVYTNRPVEPSFRETNSRYQVSQPNNYGRSSEIFDIPRVSEHAGITRTSDFGAREENYQQPISNYEMVERNTLRNSRINERVAEYDEPDYASTTVNRVTTGGKKFIPNFAAKGSFADRPTAFSSARKSKMRQNDISPISNLDISSSSGFD